jgi:hypothetical protein
MVPVMRVSGAKLPERNAALHLDREIDNVVAPESAILLWNHLGQAIGRVEARIAQIVGPMMDADRVSLRCEFGASIPHHVCRAISPAAAKYAFTAAPLFTRAVDRAYPSGTEWHGRLRLMLPVEHAALRAAVCAQLADRFVSLTEMPCFVCPVCLSFQSATHHNQLWRCLATGRVTGAAQAPSNH